MAGNSKFRKKMNSFKFVPFSKKQKQLLSFWTENSPHKDKDVVIADGSIRSGKDQPLSALLYTPDGYKTMGDIQVGDYVFSEKGISTKVIGVFPQEELKDIYEIEFHDGSKTRCSDTHLWTYTTKKCVANGNKTMFTSELRDIMLDLEKYKNEKHMNKRAGKYRFNINGCVEFNEKNVEIDPYLLGLLLGDGCFTKGNSGITFTNSENELHSYIASVLPLYNMNYKLNEAKNNHCAYGQLRNNKKGIKSYLRIFLEKYGLNKKYSHEKFIPNEYKFNSKEIRLKILAGLLNTDGNVIVDRPSIRYNTSSKQLLEDIVFIARSLGMFVNTNIKVDERGKNENYMCNIRVNDDLYGLLSSKHKSKLKMDYIKKKEYKIIKSISYVGKEKTKCIKVDNPTELYLTDDFIITHNTVCMSLSFVLFVMNNFNQCDAGMCGKTVGTFKKNVLAPLKQMLLALDYDFIEYRNDNILQVMKNDVVNYFRIYGGKDEGSQDLIQGATLCSVYFDEVALMPQSFVHQGTARCSITGSKLWFNCNPNSPFHWFYKEYIEKREKKNALYLHFTMDDNNSLDPKIKERYENLYSGVFYRRYIKGEWCMAEGIIYDMFEVEKHVIDPSEVPLNEIYKWWVSIDYGTSNATVFLLQGQAYDGTIYCFKEYYYNAGDKERPKEQKTDLEYAEDLRGFINHYKPLTGKGYRDIDIFVDPSALSFKTQLRRLHFKVKNAKNDVIDGIRYVATLLKSGKLLICSGCENLIKEFTLYSWDKKAQERGEDMPEKVNDHAMDGLRYGIFSNKPKVSTKDIAIRTGI